MGHHSSAGAAAGQASRWIGDPAQRADSAATPAPHEKAAAGRQDRARGNPPRARGTCSPDALTLSLGRRQQDRVAHAWKDAAGRRWDRLGGRLPVDAPRATPMVLESGHGRAGRRHTQLQPADSIERDRHAQAMPEHLLESRSCQDLNNPRSLPFSGLPNVPAFSCGRQRERSDRQARLLQRLVGRRSDFDETRTLLPRSLERSHRSKCTERCRKEPRE
jgi:hypothetical protein